MTAQPEAQQTTAAPIARSERITNLDTVRGIATLGILLMNAVSFGLIDAAYFNLDADGSDNALDWVVGVVGEVFVDQKMMALFSMLFGAGIVVFADRAAAKGRRPVWLSLWRNLLLLGIGFVHSLIWMGDILMLYAGCAPVLLLFRKRSPKLLIGIGTGLILCSAAILVATQLTVDGTVEDFGSLWFDSDFIPEDGAGLAFFVDAIFRALGFMLIGVGLFRLRIVHGTHSPEFYRRLVWWGLGVGLPVSIASQVVVIAGDFSADVALASWAMTTASTIPIALAYLGIITLWNQRPETPAHERVRAVGRMALTNYLTQTLIGVLVLDLIFDKSLGRFWLLVFCVGVWVLQLVWSQPWLERFRFGPFEWLWRMATYRSWQPLRR